MPQIYREAGDKIGSEKIIEKYIFLNCGYSLRAGTARSEAFC